MTPKLYQIRNKTTGLFSSGGPQPHWVRVGEIWPHLGVLKLHMLNAHQPQNLHVHPRRPDFYGDDCEIVIYIPSEGETLVPSEVMAEYRAEINKKAARKAAKNGGL